MGLLDVCDLQHRVEGVEDGLGVGVDAPGPVAGVGVAPRDDEHLLALGHQVLDQAAARSEVDGVVLVDHRRDDQQRHGPDPVGLGRVLDQLEHGGAMDHCAGGDGEGLAHLEGRRLDHGGYPGCGRHVPGQVGGAPQEAGPAGVDGGLPGHRAEDRVVARGGRVDQVVDQEPDPQVVAEVEVGVGDDRLGGLGGGEIGLKHAVQHRVARPGRVAEAPVPFGRRQGRGADGDPAVLAEKIVPPHDQLPGPPAEPSGQAESLPPGPKATELAERRPRQHQVQGSGAVRPAVVDGGLLMSASFRARFLGGHHQAAHDLSGRPLRQTVDQPHLAGVFVGGQPGLDELL
jgi:hypothetical protein